MFQQLGNRAAKERGNDGGRCLVRTQTVGIRGGTDGGFQQPVVVVHRFQRLHDKGHEADVVQRGLARSMEQHTGVGGKRPVVVLAGAVHAFERFLMEQAPEAMLDGYALHDRHHQHVVVDGKVCLLVDWSQLKLVGGYLVVAGLAGDAKLQCLNLNVAHEILHALRNGSEIVVVHLLVLGRVMAHQCAAGHHQVWTGTEQRLVNQEIFLLPTQVASHLLHLGVEILAYGGGCLIDGVQRFLQWHLVVECLTREGDENRRNHQRVANHKHRRSRIPGRIAAGLECGADAAVRERRGVRLLLNQQLAFKFLNHAAFAVVLHKAVVLLGCAFRQWLKPVGIVGHAQLHCPFLHTLCHGIGYRQVERSTVVYHVAHLLINSTIFSYTSFGRYLYIFFLSNTYLPKYSEGRSSGTFTLTGRFLNASSTTLNLSFDAIYSCSNFFLSGFFLFLLFSFVFFCKVMQKPLKSQI